MDEFPLPASVAQGYLGADYPWDHERQMENQFPLPASVAQGYLGADYPWDHERQMENQSRFCTAMALEKGKRENEKRVVAATRMFGFPLPTSVGDGSLSTNYLWNQEPQTEYQFLFYNAMALEKRSREQEMIIDAALRGSETLIKLPRGFGCQYAPPGFKFRTVVLPYLPNPANETPRFPSPIAGHGHPSSLIVPLPEFGCQYAPPGFKFRTVTLPCPPHSAN